MHTVGKNMKKLFVIVLKYLTKQLHDVEKNISANEITKKVLHFEVKDVARKSLGGGTDQCGSKYLKSVNLRSSQYKLYVMNEYLKNITR